MTNGEIKGRVHSFQSLGTVDGPGVRFVVFLQGCPLRCGCCHNPDTWDKNGGELFSPKDIVDKAARFKDYFGERGGLTLSGGEPLIQAEFATAIFKECRAQNVNTCLDTSGCILNDKVKALLEYTDRVLLDIKYTDDLLYRNHVGCEYEAVKKFLNYLNDKNIPVWLRQVIIPTLNDTEENICTLREIAREYVCVEKIELLPFKKICQVKYDNMNIKFPFKDVPTPTKERMDYLNGLIKN